MNSFDLSGRSAVVTGGGQGIGEGIAKNLAAAGASVIVAARHVDRIERVAREINVAGGTAIAMATDVTDTAAVEALADAALDEFGGLHVWVNNAGGSPVRTSLSEIGDNEWETCLQLNLTAVWKGAVVAFERMKSGAIINITSPAGEVAVPGSGHYGAAKAGVNSLTKNSVARVRTERPSQRHRPRLRSDRSDDDRARNRRRPTRKHGAEADPTQASRYPPTTWAQPQFIWQATLAAGSPVRPLRSQAECNQQPGPQRKVRSLP